MSELLKSWSFKEVPQTVLRNRKPRAIYLAFVDVKHGDGVNTTHQN